MFCSKCGDMVPEGDRFCANCGTPITNDSNTQTDVASTASGHYDIHQFAEEKQWNKLASNAKKTPKKPLLIIITIVIVVIIIVAVANGGNSSIIGTWGSVNNSGTITIVQEYTFRNDGTYYFIETTSSYEEFEDICSYQIEGDTITREIPSGVMDGVFVSEKFIIEGDTLYIGSDKILTRIN